MSDRDDLLRDLIDEPIEPGHMNAMLAGVEGRLERQRRRRRSGAITAALSVAAALALLVVPASYVLNLGTHVSVSWPRDQVLTKTIEAELSRLDGLAARKTVYSGDTVHCRAVIRGRGEDEAAELVRSAIRAYFPAGAAPDVGTRPVFRRVQGNVLAAITYGHFRVNARGLSDRELEQAIMRELGLMGVVEPEVSVSRSEEERLLIDVKTMYSPVDSFTFEVSFE